MAVKGTTPELREAARRKKTCDNRAEMYVQLMHHARWDKQSPKETLRHACEFLRAVAAGMDASDVYEMAEQITRLADERNKP